MSAADGTLFSTPTLHISSNQSIVKISILYTAKKGIVNLTKIIYNSNYFSCIDAQ